MQAESIRTVDWTFVDGGARWVIFCPDDLTPSDPMKRQIVRSRGGPSMQAAAIISSAG